MDRTTGVVNTNLQDEFQELISDICTVIIEEVAMKELHTSSDTLNKQVRKFNTFHNKFKGHLEETGSTIDQLLQASEQAVQLNNTAKLSHKELIRQIETLNIQETNKQLVETIEQALKAYECNLSEITKKSSEENTKQIKKLSEQINKELKGAKKEQAKAANDLQVFVLKEMNQMNKQIEKQRFLYERYVKNTLDDHKKIKRRLGFVITLLLLFTFGIMGVISYYYFIIQGVKLW